MGYTGLGTRLIGCTIKVPRASIRGQQRTMVILSFTGTIEIRDKHDATS